MFIWKFVYHCLFVLVLKISNGKWPIKYTYTHIHTPAYLWGLCWHTPLVRTISFLANIQKIPSACCCLLPLVFILC